MSDGSPDKENTLRKKLVEEASKRKKQGASLRWQVTSDEVCDIFLQLQSLPAPQATVSSKPVLNSDNAAVQVIDSWELSVDKFDESTGLLGPIPAFFTDEPEKTRATLYALKVRLMDQLNKFYTRYKDKIKSGNVQFAMNVKKFSEMRDALKISRIRSQPSYGT